MNDILKIEISEIQKYLTYKNIDGWILYDFWGINKIVREIFDIKKYLPQLSRRWFYYIPKNSKPIFPLWELKCLNPAHHSTESLLIPF